MEKDSEDSQEIQKDESVLHEQKVNHVDKLVVSRGLFMGVERISIRIYTRNRDGSYSPTKKGVSIPTIKFRAFQNAITAIRLPGETQENNDAEEPDRD